MIVPHYIGEGKSDMRGIKPGGTRLRTTATYLPDLFPATRNASRESISRPTEPEPPSCNKGRTETLLSDIRRRGRCQGIEPKPP